MSHQERYRQACHAMQTGVATEMVLSDRHAETEPKHLRVGVNSAMVDSAALAKLLVAKGVFTSEEWWKTLADEMEREVASYVQRIFEKTGQRVVLR